MNNSILELQQPSTANAESQQSLSKFKTIHFFRSLFVYYIDNHDTPPTTTLNGNSKVDNQQQTVSNDSKSPENDDNDGWHLVGTFKTTTADVKHYYVVPSKINIDNYVSNLFSSLFAKSISWFFFRISIHFKYII
jgi:hypothetical protein